MIRSCIVVVYLGLLTLPAGAAVRGGAAEQRADGGADLDALYRDRERPDSARAAERGWAARVAADAADFEAAWKLARTRYWLGTNGPGTGDEKKRLLEAGIAAGRLAAAARPDAPEGHFWMAANMGALADAHGLRQGIKYRTPIREALEKALAIDPAFLDGSPDRALGRWYFKVPRLFGGDLEKSEAHLRKALGYNESSIISMLFLAEALLERDKKDEARALLRKAIATPPDPDWGPEDARFKADAAALLKKASR